MPLKKGQWQILKYTVHIKPTPTMYILNNLQGQLSQSHELIFSLNNDRDGARVISVWIKFYNWSTQ